MLNTLDTLKEYALIVRGNHTGWSGDRILNGEFFASTIRRDTPEEAARLAADVKANLKDLSDETGLPPFGLLRFISYLSA